MCECVTITALEGGPWIQLALHTDWADGLPVKTNLIIGKDRTLTDEGNTTIFPQINERSDESLNTTQVCLAGNVVGGVLGAVYHAGAGSSQPNRHFVDHHCPSCDFLLPSCCRPGKTAHVFTLNDCPSQLS